MTIKSKLIILITISMLMLTSAGCSDQKTSAPEKDNHLSILHIDQTETPQAKTTPFIFVSENDSLIGRIMIAAGSNKKPTVIFLHGMPGIEKNEDIGQALRRAGYNAAFFSYSGTWGNQGVFSYKKSLKNIEALNAHLIKNAKHYKIDCENIFLCGFSMGADIAIFHAHEASNISGVISIAPWSAKAALQSKSAKDLTSYKSNLGKQLGMKIGSGEAFVTEIINYEKTINEYLSSSNVPIIHIFENKSTKDEFQENCPTANPNSMLIMDASDHSFSNKRILLTEIIFNWLNDHCKK